MAEEDVKQRIDERTWALLDICRRAFVLEAFAAELDRVRRGKDFTIWNDIVWRMHQDTEDMLVIDLAAWARGTYGEGGLLGQLQGKFSRSVTQKSATVEKVSRHLKKYFAAMRRERYQRLFPDACKGRPSGRDFEQLRESFEKALNSLVADRDANRAHRYEVRKQSPARRFSVSEIRSVIGYTEQFINDLKHVTDDASFVFLDMNIAGAAATAKPLVDMVLLGDLEFASEVGADGLGRERLYELMHERHDALGNLGLMFNGEQVRLMLLEEHLAVGAK